MEDLLLAARVVLALAAVLGAIFWLRRKIGAKVSQGNTTLALVARRNISQKASVAVVDFDGRRLLLGVTDAAVNVLSDVPQPAPPQFEAAMEKAAVDASTPAQEPAPAPAAEHGALAGSIFAKSSWTSMAAALSGGKK